MAVSATHSAKYPKVFKNARTKLNKTSTQYDIALMYIPMKTARYNYRIPGRGLNISEELFLKIIPDYNVYYKAVNGVNLPVMLTITAAKPKMLNREVSVISIWDGTRSVLPARDKIFYLPAKKYLVGQNFGIIQGISGSGVMTNTGELVGIISATANLQKTDNATKKTAVVPMVFITPFDQYATNFIKNTAGVTNFKKADKNFLKPLPAAEREVINSLNNLKL
jgi:hypothetical protein